MPVRMRKIFGWSRAFSAPAVLALALAGLIACASPPPAGPYMLAPANEKGEPLPIDGPIRAEKEGVAIEIEPLTAAGRAEWLRKNAAVSKDPLTGHPEADKYLTFRLRLDAIGDLPVILNTQGLRLWPDKGRVSTAPLDYTRAFELLRPDSRDSIDKEQVERFMRGLYDGSITVPPGEVREGLLIFPEPSPESKVITFDLAFLQVGSESHRIQLALAKVWDEQP